MIQRSVVFYSETVEFNVAVSTARRNNDRHYQRMTGVMFTTNTGFTYVPVFRYAVSYQLMQSCLDLNYLNSSLFSLVLKLLHPLTSGESFLQ